LEERFRRREEIREKLNIEQDAKVVITVARMVKEKGYYELVKAIKILCERDNSIKAIFVGDGPERGKIMKMVKELKLEDNVLILGDREDVPDLLCGGDVFTLPSWGEGQPVAPTEAMACGLPVVLTDVRGCREEVIEGVNGFLVPPRNPQALADALEKLLKDDEMRRKMGEKAEKIAVKYDIKALLDFQVKIYKQLLFSNVR
jgi:glycosyltransferase involved in cell wall biosynthesis